MSQRPSPMCFVLVVSSPLVGWSWKMASWGLCPALDVFVSVWFGVPTVRLVVAKPGPAASLTDDLQLARLAWAAAVAHCGGAVGCGHWPGSLLGAGKVLLSLSQDLAVTPSTLSAVQSVSQPPGRIVYQPRQFQWINLPIIYEKAPQSKKMLYILS